MLFLSLLLGCGSDHFLSHGSVEKQIEYVYVQDNYIEGSDDTGMNEPIWVDSFTQPVISNGVDIIWVIDGSGSMNDDYVSVLQGITDMMQNLPMINWRLVIIYMTPHEAASVESFPLLPGDSWEDAHSMFAENVQGHQEYGFDSVYEFLENNRFAANWLRDDASLLVVFVSDEDDQSISQFPTVSLYKNWLDGKREHVYVSSIVNIHPEQSECNGYTHNVGFRYSELTNSYAGQLLDICSEDWSQGVADASNQIQLREWYDLSNKPLNDQEIYVFVDGQEFFDWHYDEIENRVYFDVVPGEESLVEIAYYY